jgi:uncharacterized protein YcbX
MTAKIQSIYRYPVKGLTPEPLPEVRLAVGQTLPADRKYALENGPTGFDPAAPAYLPKTRFLMLMKNERLAQLRSHYDDATCILTISLRGRVVAHGDVSTVSGREVIEFFFEQFCAEDLRGPARMLEAPGHSFSDVAAKVVSIINLASVAEVEKAIGARVDPLRFRGNVMVAGWQAWRELELVGREIALGADARVKIVKRIVRCPATNVDPDTGARDLEVPATIKRLLGHMDCGIYGEVIAAGRIAPGDAVAER